MASPRDVLIRVTVDDQGAVQKFQELGRAEKDAKDAALETSSGLESVEKSLFTVGNAAKITAVGAAGLAASLTGVILLAKRGGEFNDISGAFDATAEKAGKLSDVFLGSLREGTRGLVSDFDLMRSANDAALAGLSPDLFEDVATAAAHFGKAIGKDATESVNDLSNALQTGRVQALRNYGVFIDASDVINKFTGGNKELNAAIDDQTRITLIQIEAARQLRNVNKNLGDSEKGLGDQVDTLSVSWRNFVDELGGAIDKSPEAARAVGQLDAGFKVLAPTIITAVEKFNDFTGAAATWAATGADAVINKTRSISNALTEFGKGINPEGGFTGLFHAITGEIDKSAVALARQGDIAKKAKQNAQDFYEWAEEQNKNQNAPLIAAQKISDAEKKETEALANLRKELEKKAEVERQVADKERARQKDIDDYNKKLKEHADLVKLVASAYGKEDLAGKIDKVIGIYQKGLIPIDALGKELHTLKEEWIGAGGSAAEFKRIADLGLDKTITETTEKIDGLAGSLEKVETAADKAFGEQLQRNLADAVSAIGDVILGTAKIDDALGGIGKSFGATIGNSLGQSLGASIGGIAGEVGGPLGTAIGSAIGAQLGKDIAGFGKNPGSAGRVFSALGLDTFFPGAGALGGKFVDSIFGDSDADKLRKRIDAFFNDLGFDLTVKGNEFGGVFDTLGENAKGTFSGIGTAFASLADGMGEDGQIIANVIANNVGGSLNDLQLRIGDTGASFDDMKKAIEKTYLAGNITGNEFLQSLHAIEEISSKGIPGALGDIDGAINNLIQSGGVGRAVLDALQDTAVEAKEANIKTLDDLRKKLEASGTISKEKLDQIFNTFAALGIKTLDQLENASVITAANIGGAFENQGNFFENQGKNLQELLQTLKEIPDRVESNIHFNVTASYSDDGARQIAEGQGIRPAQGIPARV